MPENQVIDSAQEVKELPLLARREVVLFPHIGAQLLCMRERTLRTVDEALARDRAIVVVARRDDRGGEITLDSVYQIGTEAIIGRVLKMPDGVTSVWVHGQRRVRIAGLIEDPLLLRASVVPIEDPTDKPLPTEALMRAVLALFEKCVKLSDEMSDDVYISALNADEPG